MVLGMSGTNARAKKSNKINANILGIAANVINFYLELHYSCSNQV